MLASFAGDVVVVVATLVTEQPRCVHAYDRDARNGAGSMVSNHDARLIAVYCAECPVLESLYSAWAGGLRLMLTIRRRGAIASATLKTRACTAESIKRGMGVSSGERSTVSPSLSSALLKQPVPVPHSTALATQPPSPPPSLSPMAPSRSEPVMHPAASRQANQSRLRTDLRPSPSCAVRDCREPVLVQVV